MPRVVYSREGALPAPKEARGRSPDWSIVYSLFIVETIGYMFLVVEILLGKGFYVFVRLVSL